MNWPDLNPHSFGNISNDEWMSLISKELKGNVTNWFPDNRLSISPYVHSAEGAQANPLPPKALTSSGNDWLITQSFTANDHLLDGLKNGVGRIRLSALPADYERLLTGVFLNMVHIAISGNSSDIQGRLEALYKIAKDQSGQLSLDVLWDPLSESFQIGKEMNSDQEKNLAATCAWIKDRFPKARPLCVQSSRFFAAGATHSLELAVALSWSRMYIEMLGRHGFSVDDASAMLSFEMAADSNVFVTQAKFRALRLAYAAMIEGMKAQHDCSAICAIHGVVDTKYYASADINNNLIRNTLAALAAVNGGVDSLEIPPHNMDITDVHALRWSRNVHHLLKEEAGLDRVYDPGFGVGYVESLTQSLLTNAYELLEQFGDRTTVFAQVTHLLKEDQDALTESLNQSEKPIIGVTRFSSSMSYKLQKTGMDKLAPLELITK
ncbi:MAG: hypothetical protein RL226_1198 [Bacteroidota bacterium]|jgi:methylmalonyl-CoA mutase N-terminal domain/subunit